VLSVFVNAVALLSTSSFKQAKAQDTTPAPVAYAATSSTVVGQSTTATTAGSSATCIALGQACVPIGDFRLDASSCCDSDLNYCLGYVCTQCLQDATPCDHSQQCCGTSTCKADSNGQKSCGVCAYEGDSCTSDEECCFLGEGCVNGQCQLGSSAQGNSAMSPPSNSSDSSGAAAKMMIPIKFGSHILHHPVSKHQIDLADRAKPCKPVPCDSSANWICIPQPNCGCNCSKRQPSGTSSIGKRK